MNNYLILNYYIFYIAHSLCQSLFNWPWLARIMFREAVWFMEELWLISNVCHGGGEGSSNCFYDSMHCGFPNNIHDEKHLHELENKVLIKF